jgi:hypothetical protein
MMKGQSNEIETADWHIRTDGISDNSRRPDQPGSIGGGLRASRAKRDPQMPDESAAKKDVRSQVSG